MFGLKITELKTGVCNDLGLKLSDILLNYNNCPLDSSETLSELMKKYAGETHVLKFIHDGEILETNLPAGPLGIFVHRVTIQEKIAKKLIKNIQISTTPFIPEYEIVASVDVITAECAFGMNILKDFAASISDTFGGRSESVQRVLRDARRICLAELKAEAAAIGANAVVGINLDYNQFSGQGKSMLFLVASGTAVQVQPTLTSRQS